MKGILLLNGEPYGGEIDCSGAYTVCCDGAYLWAKDRVRIDENVGDFDSLPFIPDPPPSEIYPSEKNFTDGEIALSRLLAAGADEIEIYGGSGGRADHFLGNIHLLYRAAAAGIKCVMADDASLIFCVRDKIFLGEYEGKTFSVLPLGGEVHIMEYGGLKYSYPDKLTYGECRGISNIVTSPEAFLCVRGYALVMINKGKV